MRSSKDSVFVGQPIRVTGVAGQPPVSFASITNADDLNRLRARFAKDYAPITVPEAIMWRIETLSLFDIAGFGFEEAGQGFEQPSFERGDTRLNSGLVFRRDRFIVNGS